MNTNETIARMESSQETSSRRGDNPMESVFLFVGVIALYFAMQLWILPRFGINT